MGSLDQALNTLVEVLLRHSCGFVSCRETQSSVLAELAGSILQVYGEFLRDPRGATRKRRVPVYPGYTELFRQAAAAPEMSPEIKAAAELCQLLLSIADVNNITAESIKEDRKLQRFLLDWPYSETVPDSTPQPAVDQVDGYQRAAEHLVEATMTAEQSAAEHEAQAAFDCTDRPLRYGAGPLSCIASHPSVQFLHGWLLLKIGSATGLASAVQRFTAAAAHPLLRSSCMLLRGLCLLYLEELPTAQQELLAGLQFDSEQNDASKAEPALLIEAHSALAVIAAKQLSPSGGNGASSGDASSSTAAVGTSSTIAAQPLLCHQQHSDVAAVGSADAQLLQQGVEHYHMATQVGKEYAESIFAAKAALFDSDGLWELPRLRLDAWTQPRTGLDAVAHSFQQEAVTEAESSRLLRQARTMLAPSLPEDPAVKIYHAIRNLDNNVPSRCPALDDGRVAKQKAAGNYWNGTSSTDALGPYESFAIIRLAKEQARPELRAIAASWNIEPVFSIHDLRPFPAPLMYCQRCGKTGGGAELVPCSRCRQTMYCSAQCQSRDVDVHTSVCKAA